jgi:hypothetical protein
VVEHFAEDGAGTRWPSPWCGRAVLKWVTYSPRTETKVVFAQDDDVVETLASDAAEESFADGVHQWGPYRRLQDADACDACRPIEGRAELAIPVTDDELRSLAERRDVAELLCRPAFARLSSHGDIAFLVAAKRGRAHGSRRRGPRVPGDSRSVRGRRASNCLPAAA